MNPLFQSACNMLLLCEATCVLMCRKVVEHTAVWPNLRFIVDQVKLAKVDGIKNLLLSCLVGLCDGLVPIKDLPAARGQKDWGPLFLLFVRRLLLRRPWWRRWG